MAGTYGGSFVMRLDGDTDYDIGFIIKEVGKVLKERNMLEKRKRYTKTSCVEDIIRLRIKDKENLVKEILQSKGVEII